MYTHVKAKTGEIKNVVLIPEKYIFDPNIEKCRDKPYNDILVKSMLRHMKNKCSKTCMPLWYQYYTWICNPDLETQFSLCDDPKENGRQMFLGGK